MTIGENYFSLTERNEQFLSLWANETEIKCGTRIVRGIFIYRHLVEKEKRCY